MKQNKNTPSTNKEKLLAAQEKAKAKSTSDKVDLDNEVLIEKDTLDTLANSKFEEQIIKVKKTANKKWKIMTGIFAATAAAGVAATVALSVGISKSTPASSAVVVECLSKTQNDDKYGRSVTINNLTQPKLNSEYKFELKLPENTTIDSLDIQIESKSIEGFTLENNTVTIPAEKMTGTIIVIHVNLWYSLPPSPEKTEFTQKFSSFYNNYQQSGEGETHKFKSVSVPEGTLWNGKIVKSLKIKYINKIPFIYFNDDDQDVIQAANNTPQEMNQMLDILEQAQLNPVYASTDTTCQYSIPDSANASNLYSVTFNDKGYITHYSKNIEGYESNLVLNYSDTSTEVTKTQFLEKLKKVETDFIASTDEYTPDQVKVFKNEKQLFYKRFRYETPTIHETQSKVLKAYFQIEQQEESIDLSVGDTFHSTNLAEILPEESEKVEYKILENEFSLKWIDENEKSTKVIFNNSGYITSLITQEKSKSPNVYSVIYTSDPKPSTGRTEFLNKYSEVYETYKEAVELNLYSNVEFQHDDFIKNNDDIEYLSVATPVYSTENETVSITTTYSQYDDFGMFEQKALESKLTALEQNLKNKIKYFVDSDSLGFVVQNSEESYYSWYVWNNNGFLIQSYVPDKMYINATWDSTTTFSIPKQDWLSKYQKISDSFLKFNIAFASDSFELKLGKEEWFDTKTVGYSTFKNSSNINIPELNYCSPSGDKITLGGGKLSSSEIQNTLHMSASDGKFKEGSSILTYSSETDQIFIEFDKATGLVKKYIDKYNSNDIDIRVEMKGTPMVQIEKQTFQTHVLSYPDFYKAHFYTSPYTAVYLCAGSNAGQGAEVLTDDCLGIPVRYNDVQMDCYFPVLSTAQETVGGIGLVLLLILMPELLKDSDNSYFFMNDEAVSVVLIDKQTQGISLNMCCSKTLYMKCIGAKNANMFYRYV